MEHGRVDSIQYHNVRYQSYIKVATNTKSLCSNTIFMCQITLNLEKFIIFHKCNTS